MAAGFRSPLPPLGIGAPPSVQAGVSSMLAFWAGGVGRAQAGTQAGARSMFAFWMGGALAGAVAAASTTSGGGGIDAGYRRRRARERTQESALRDERDIADFICIWTLLNDINR